MHLTHQAKYIGRIAWTLKWIILHHFDRYTQLRILSVLHQGEQGFQQRRLAPEVNTEYLFLNECRLKIKMRSGLRELGRNIIENLELFI